MSDVTLHTSGDGWWSKENRPVRITKLELDHDDPIEKFGELKVYFNTEDWRIREHGLIYTDSLFLKELRNHLNSIGLSGRIDYSEQGMQGDDYVSLDVFETFLLNWCTKYGECDGEYGV